MVGEMAYIRCASSWGHLSASAYWGQLTSIMAGAVDICIEDS